MTRPTTMEERLHQLTLRFNAIDSGIQSIQSHISIENQKRGEKQQKLKNAMLQWNNSKHDNRKSSPNVDNDENVPLLMDTDCTTKNFEGLQLLDSNDMSSDVNRVRDACIQLGLSRSSLHKVPSDYYSYSLNDRAKMLNCPSIHMLCKSMILENTKCVNPDNSDPNNAKFYCIVMQYTTKLSSDKVMRFLRELNENKLGKRQFYFRLAREEDQVRLTGYKFNAVSPVGMTDYVPIILAKSIVSQKLGSIFLGGGEIDVKLRVSVQEFIDQVKPLIADVTDPDPTRTGDSTNMESSEDL